MNIVACVKQVPDTAVRLKVAGDGRSLDTREIPLVLNPYDEYAVEEALRLKEKHGGTVTLVTVGPERANEALKAGIAMGADAAVRVWDDSLFGIDVMSVSRVLVAALMPMAADVILFGRQAVDDGAAAVGSAVAELLDIPCVSTVSALDVDSDGTAVARQETEGGWRMVKMSLPAVFTAQKGLNTPRYASLPGIMRAKKTEIRVMGPESILESGAVIVSLALPPERTPGEVLTGDLGEVVKEAVKRLREKGLVQG